MKSIRMRCKDNKGSALVSVAMIIMLLTVLSLGILALTMNNVKQAATVDNYERDYYAANRAVKQGVENLKRTVQDYYNSLAILYADTTNVTAYQTAYDHFFANILANTTASFTEPALDTSSGGGPTSTVTTIEQGAVNGDVCVYTVKSTAYAGAIQRTVLATIQVIRTENLVTQYVTKFGTNALITASNIDMTGNKNAKIDVSGNVTAGGAVVENAHGGSGYFDANNYDPAHPELYVDSSIASKLVWDLSYGKFTQTAKDAAVAASAPKITNSSTVQASNYNTTPFNLEGNAGISYTITGTSTATGGQIGSASDLTLSSCTLTGESIYVDGDLTITNSTLTNVTLYVGGSTTITNSTLVGVKLYCAGSLTATDTKFYHNSSGNACQMAVQYNTTVSGDSTGSQSKVFFYTGGVFKILSSRIDSIIVYAGSEIDILLESNGSRKGNRTELMGMLYSNGTATINSCLITGQLVVRGKVYADPSVNSSTLSDLVFAPTDLTNLLNDPSFLNSIFNQTTLGEMTSTYVKPLISEMYANETVAMEQ